MVFRTILYISKSMVLMPGAQDVVRRMVDSSRRWNGLVGISGALIFTEVHFAQYIEGPQEAIHDMMTKLRADRRHTNIDVLEEGSLRARRFDGWNLAYSGPEAFLEREAQPIFGDRSARCRAAVAEDLKVLMGAMVAGGKRPANFDMPARALPSRFG